MNEIGNVKDSPEELFPEEMVMGGCGLFAYSTEIWIEERIIFLR